MQTWALLGLLALSPAEPESADGALAAAALASVGCPAEAMTPTGCAVCPPDIHLHTDPRFERPEERRLTIDRFAGSGLGVLLEYTGCSSRADGDHTVVLLACQDEACAPVETYGYNDAGVCHLPRNADGEAFALCIHFGGQQGCYGADAYVLGGAGELVGWPQGTKDCENVELEVTRIADVDDDGDDDLELRFGRRRVRVEQAAGRFIAR